MPNNKIQGIQLLLLFEQEVPKFKCFYLLKFEYLSELFIYL